MRYKQLKLITLVLLALGLTGLQAQETMNTTGGNASGSGGSASYSVGQSVYLTHTGTTGSVAEGVQQPYEISVVTGVVEAPETELSITAFPNPTTDKLTLKVKDPKPSTLTFQLFDMTGKPLKRGMFSGNQTSISIGNLLPGIYFLKVVRGTEEIKVFKIIKR